MTPNMSRTPSPREKAKNRSAKWGGGRNYLLLLGEKKEEWGTGGAIRLSKKKVLWGKGRVEYAPNISHHQNRKKKKKKKKQKYESSKVSGFRQRWGGKQKGNLSEEEKEGESLRLQPRGEKK